MEAVVKVTAYVVLVLLVVAIGYAAFITLKFWPGIGV